MWLISKVGPRRNPVDVPLLIRHRLEELGLEQRDLAGAAQVTESYISQLLTRRKAPPAPTRTDIYEKMDEFLKLPRGKLATLADVQRKEELKRELGDETAPLLPEVRDLILRKCNPDNATHLRAIFEKQPFGELERLVTQTVLDVVKRVTKEEVEYLTRLRFKNKRPTPLFYYRELQNLRDSLHFGNPVTHMKRRRALSPVVGRDTDQR